MSYGPGTTEPPHAEVAPEPPAAPPAEPKPAEPRTFTQDDLNRMLADQKRKVESKFADYGDLKAKAAEADQLRKEQETAAEKALREAVEKAKADAQAELRPKLVEARFHAAAAGRIEPDRLATLTEDLDMSRYLKDDGSVDVDKITAKVEAWTPVKEEPRGPKPDPTQGARNTKTTGIDVGREMSQARHRKTSSTSP